ncbi:MAG: hypothetical protein Q9201_003468 [Fulgogasparrea decipioides]
MAPGAGGKRKRGDGHYSYDPRDENSRPSPHRPGNLSLAQQSNFQHSPHQQNPNRGQYDQRGGGRRRGSRGGRGGGNQRSPINSPNVASARPQSSEGSQNIPPAAPVVQAQPPLEATPQIQNPPTPTKKAVATQTPEQKPHDIPYYHYEYVTDEQRGAWAQSGRAEVVAAGREACSKKDRTVLSLLFQDLMRAGVDGRIDAADAGSVVKDILESVSPEDIIEHGLGRWKPAEIFLDMLSICAEAWNENTSLKPLVFATGISAQLMRLILDSSLLESLGLIRSTFVRVGIRQQTNLLYRQSNYNLLREETEGYSKLITELFTTSSGESLSSEVVEETFERVKGMIGAFDLDVGRVLDVTLDVFAAVLVKQYRFFVKYLRTSSWWPQDISSEARAVHGLDTLPNWALPGAAGRPMNDDEKTATAIARDERDKEFWQRAKEIGMKAFFEIGNRRVASAELKQALDIAATTNSPEADEDQLWMDLTETLPPVGNKVAAQILGFKLRFYSSSARDSSDTLPVNIIYLAALLIKIGFISLRDLYPHLWPSEDGMNSVKEAKMKENAEKERLSRPGGGAMNALANAKALTDDRDISDPRRARELAKKREIEIAKETAAGATKAEAGAASTTASTYEEKDELPEPAEQKVQLLKSLLCIGAIPESLYMLGRFPWLLDAFTELPEHLHRILHHCLSKVYEPLRPLKDHLDLRESSKVLDGEQLAAAKGQLQLVDAHPRKVMRWAQLDREDTNEGIDYKFYWDDWADSIPVCQTVDDVVLLCSTLLNMSGVKIGQDPTLLVKLCRIGRYSLETDRSEGNKTRWIDLSKRILLPALSLTKSNPGVANEVFDLIKGFSVHTRYTMYAEWFQGQISRLPEIKAAHDKTRAETRNVLKRISKSNVKSMARAMAKIAYSSPGAVFQLAISQIEFYENLSEAFTECARYLTYLAYDVFNWALLSAVGGGGKSRVQADGMLTSHWLQSLAVLISKVYKRYAVMSPVPLLQYLLDQLTRGNSVDLIILEELVHSMAGIVSDTNFNDRQVEAMGGGDLLQARTMLQLLDRRHESRTTGKRLMRTLAEPKLAGQLLVAIAQERENCVYKLPDKDAPAKLLGNLFDEIHRVLTQYLDFMRTTSSVSDFDSLVPDVTSLIIEFGVEPGIAFWISRASISSAMADHDTKQPLRSKQSPVKELLEVEALKADSRTPQQGQGSGSQRELSQNAMQVGEDNPDMDPKPELERSEVEMKDINQAEPISPGSAPAPGPTHTQQPWHPVLQRIMDKLTSAFADDRWQTLSPSFYVTFWQLSLRDLHVPTAAGYTVEKERLDKELETIRNDRSDLSLAATQRKTREKNAIVDIQARLMSEYKDHVTAYQQVRARLQKEKTSWFADTRSRWDEVSTALIEHCFFPRIRISSVDALYAFKMFKYLHSSGTTNFRTLVFLDHLFKERRLENMFFLCSAKEAEHFGRFLNEILTNLGQWHASKAIFEKEAYGTKKELKGFCTKINLNDSNDVYMGYEDFRRILYKWHRNIHGALKTCFNSREYMHIRNAINISKAIVQQFPVVNFMGTQQKEWLNNLLKTETERADLHLATASLHGNLGRREKEWKLPQAFCLTSNDQGVNGASTARSGSAKPVTPQPEGEGSKPMNPRAPAFEPTAHTPTNNPSRSSKPGDADAEDGEIEDAKMTDASINGVAAASAGQSGPDSARDSVLSTAKASENHQEAPTIPHDQVTSTAPGPTPSKPVPLQQTPPQGPEIPQGEGLVSSNASGQASIPPRPEAIRTISSPVTNGRLQHSLPDRPEPPTSRPGQPRMPERLGDRPLRESGRDQRFPNGSSNDGRPRMSDRDIPGQPSRVHQPPHGRGQMDHRDRSDQPLPDGRSRQELDDRRGGPVRPDTYGHGDLQQPYPREGQYAGQRPAVDPKPPVTAPRDIAMPPPSSGIPQHPDRAALIQANRSTDQSFPNNQHLDRRSETPRRDEYSISGRSSRAASPTRSDDRRPLRSDNRRDLRHDDRPPPADRPNFSDSTHSHPSRYDEGHPPAGPRTDRPSNFGQPGLNERREWIKPSPSTKPVVDPNHGRLNQDSNYGGQQPEQYGRLSSGSEVPSGPRLANGNAPPSRNLRNASAPQPQINTRPTQGNALTAPPQSPTKDRQAPTGPASRRDLSKHSTWTRQDAANDNSAQSTPATEAQDTAGIHPDRLKALHGMSNPPPPSQNPNSIQAQGNMGRPLAPQRQQPAPVTVPRGPSSQQTLSSPAGPSPTANRGPPTGPGRSDKRFAGIQGVLQQTNNTPNGLDRGGQGASIRGRGGRLDNNVNPHSSSTNSGPQRSDQFPHREDLFAGRSSGGPSTPQQYSTNDQHAAYNRDGRRGGDARDGSGRAPSVRNGARETGRDSDYAREGDRHATRRHHRSRSPSRDQGPPPPSSYRDEYDNRPPPSRRDDDGVRDLRARGGPPSSNDFTYNRDLRRPRGDAERDMRRGGPPPGDGRDMGGDWSRGGEREMRDRRDGGGGSGRKRGRGTDDGAAMMGGSAEKRPRRAI